MERDLTLFVQAVEHFTNAKTDLDLRSVFAYLPEERQDYHQRFGKMFINTDDNLYFILTTNLAEWANELNDEENFTNEIHLLLSDFWDLFEFVEDDEPLTRQKEVVQKAKEYLAQFKSLLE